MQLVLQHNIPAGSQGPVLKPTRLKLLYLLALYRCGFVVPAEALGGGLGLGLAQLAMALLK